MRRRREAVGMGQAFPGPSKECGQNALCTCAEARLLYSHVTDVPSRRTDDMESKFLSLREELVAALIQSPSELNPESVQQLVEMSLPPSKKYREIDVKGIVRANTQGQTPKELRTISTALNILEKYGRNLLNPHKPRFWRTVKFNNPVFRDTVDTIQGGRDVLRLYGYSEEQTDGLCFPEQLQEPETVQVASITVDVMLLRAELNLLLSDNHPNPRVLQELMEEGNGLEASLTADVAPERVPPHTATALSHTEYLPPDACLLCGLEPPSLHCPSCAQSLCPDCDLLFHKHPSRTHHRRVPLKERAWRSTLPPSLSTVTPDAASLRPPMEGWRSLPPQPPAPRPAWFCAACHTHNDARCVLCVACDRPRGCKIPVSLSSEDQMARGRWSCQSCTFENEASTVLCTVCERPRLAGRPGIGDAKPLMAWGEDSEVQQEELPGWQCEHCTFWNKIHGRVCEMCNRTSQRGGPEPASLRPRPEEEEKPKKEPANIKADPKCLLKSLSLEDAEHRRQAKLREDGQKMVAMIREAEAVGVAPEMVAAALHYSGAELPLAWLNSELPCVLEGVAELATQRGEEEPGGGLGAVTQQEAQTAWMESQGDVDEAVSRCLSARRSKVRELKVLGFAERGPVLQALYQNKGDVWQALVQLQRLRLEPFHQRLWETEEPPIDFQSPDRQALLRRLLASLSLPSWGRAELVVSLMLEKPSEGGWELADIVEAVKASPSRDFIKRLLSWECAVCSWALPRNKMQSLTSCECTICPDCFTQHFTIAVKEKHITDLVCPACSEPEISDERELLSYFSTLDIQLRSCLDLETYELFHKKLTERVLMRDPKFQWCTHCSFGFIYESEQLEAKCPQCRKSFCVRCRRPWEPQHQGLTCEGFQEWKRTNDPEYQAQGLAAYLQENGIACPNCKFSYALARGGCMHFHCTQCRHHFCSGCYSVFHAKNKCPLQGCLIRRSLHAHHPRDCLFYLRDWDVVRLQRLLQDNGVVFNTDPPAGTRATTGGGCQVMEQKETMAGLKDEPCGKETQAGYAGLCQAHYKEYLVSLINSYSLDPAALYNPQEAELVCQRYLPAAQLPPRGPAEDDETFAGRLIKKLMDEVALGPKIPRRQKQLDARALH
ncbi:E3 ubiquitin-protein ligase RNF31 isoform X2 [Eublepharis macularius]|uniref:RBR-type E3 ubiquitin transferase n=1 Tax=Eublepharis macularius TaxID=481883 RepID=A0AA97L9Y1_EUBMA|nr:E3 ubiquitin-protein ligase RNF31 isoform X2 [Eublepharis macularius]